MLRSCLSNFFLELKLPQSMLKIDGIIAMFRDESQLCSENSITIHLPPFEHTSKKGKEKSRECHNHKAQSNPDTKRNRKRQKVTHARESYRPALYSLSELINAKED